MMEEQNSPTDDDPIIAEIRKFREEFSKRFNGDIHAMAEEMSRIAEQSGRPSVTRPPRRPPGWTPPPSESESYIIRIRKQPYPD
jgi:hypothetical protein